MVEEHDIPEYLPYNDFIQLIQSGDFDLSQLKTSLEQLSQTEFGRHLAQKTEVVTSNTGVHAILRGELHAEGTKKQEFYHDNLPIRQEVANRIQQDTGYTFNPQVVNEEQLPELWEALDAFTGLHTDQATRDKINQKVPNKFPPDIYKVPWIGQDEVVIRQSDYYAIDRDVAPGHILNVGEHTYTAFKGGQQTGRMSFADVSDYDIAERRSRIYVRLSEKPLSQTHFTDRISSGARNEFVYVNPQSPYLRPNSPQAQLPTS